MVFAVVAAMAFQNVSRRDNAHNFVVTRLAGLQMWQEVVIEDRAKLDPHAVTAQPTLYCEFRFVAQADRDAFYADLVSQMSGAQGPVAGSWIEQHTCYHDQGEHQPCVITGRQNY